MKNKPCVSNKKVNVIMMHTISSMNRKTYNMREIKSAHFLWFYLYKINRKAVKLKFCQIRNRSGDGKENQLPKDHSGLPDLKTIFYKSIVIMEVKSTVHNFVILLNIELIAHNLYLNRPLKVKFLMKIITH